jgi:hypothetical protein
MSDRPSAVNGKRSQAWGTMHECPACGQCLCFACHPAGPCVDDHAGAASADADAFASGGFSASSASAWLTVGPMSTPGASGLRMRESPDAAGERLR